MAFLYVTEPGSVLRKKGERFIVEKDDKELLEVEARRLEAVLMLDSVHVTTPALCEMLSFGIEFAIMSRNGKLLGQLTPPLARNIFIRKAQFQKETDPAFGLVQSKEIVRAKIENSRQVLLRHASEADEGSAALQSSLDRLKELRDKTAAVPDRSTLLGIEGAAAAAYWSVFGELLKAEGISFAGRAKHPPPDPVNAVLSFGYTLLTNALHFLLDGMGFDPFVGFYHEESYGRPSLALDVIEPFRAPVVDRFAVRLFNLGTLKADSFEPDPEGGLRLEREAFKAFFQHWEKHLARMKVRQAFREQAEQLVKVFNGEQELIKPWTWSAQ